MTLCAVLSCAQHAGFHLIITSTHLSLIFLPVSLFVYIVHDIIRIFISRIAIFLMLKENIKSHKYMQ